MGTQIDLKAIFNITNFYEEKEDYYKNLDIVFDQIDEKISHYISEMTRLGKVWTDELSNVLENENEELENGNENLKKEIFDL